MYFIIFKSIKETFLNANLSQGEGYFMYTPPNTIER